MASASTSDPYLATLDDKVRSSYISFEEREKAKSLAKSVVYKNTLITSTKKKNTIAAYNNKSGGSNVSFTVCCDALGSDAYGFIYQPPKNPEPKMHSISYSLVSNESSTDGIKPLFCKTPPGYVLHSSMWGLGQKKVGKDIPLERVHKLVLVFGIRKCIEITDEDGQTIKVPTDEIDLWPIWSKYHINDYISRDPNKRNDLGTEGSLQHPRGEVQRCADNVDKFIEQAVSYLLRDKDLIFKNGTRYTDVENEADLKLNKWADEQIEIYKKEKKQNQLDGTPILQPKLSEKEWRTSRIGAMKKQQLLADILKERMGLPIDPVNSERLENIKTVIMNSFVYDLMNSPEGIGKPEAVILELAKAKTEEYVENNPDILDRLVTFKFQRKVWTCPKSKEAQKDKDINEVNAKYSMILDELKHQFPSDSENELKLKADAEILDFIVNTVKWSYNIPEITTWRNERAIEKNHVVPTDRFLKPYQSLSVGSCISVSFMPGLSIPVEQKMAYSAKFYNIGKINLVYPAIIPPIKTEFNSALQCGLSNEDFERKFGKIYEIAHKKNDENEAASSAEHTESEVEKNDSELTSIRKQAPSSGLMYGSAEPEDPNDLFNDFERQNVNEESSVAKSSTDEKSDSTKKTEKSYAFKKRGPIASSNDYNAKKARR